MSSQGNVHPSIQSLIDLHYHIIIIISSHITSHGQDETRQKRHQERRSWKHGRLPHHHTTATTTGIIQHGSLRDANRQTACGYLTQMP